MRRYDPKTPSEGTAEPPSPELQLGKFLEELESPGQLREREEGLAIQIEAQAQRYVDQHFQDSYTAVEQLYQSVQTTVQEPDGSTSTKFDWTRVTGQDLETVIFLIGQECDQVREIVDRAYMRVHFSYFVWDDEYWELYRKPLGGTVGDRTAYARENSRESRYQYLFQYWFWYLAKQTLEAFVQKQKDLRWAIERRINDRSGVYGD